VILFTGYSDIVSRERFAEAGIKDCLMKPLTRKDLAESIRRVLDENQTSGESPAAETGPETKDGR
jgi:FixJ family two-component response regulator